MLLLATLIARFTRTPVLDVLIVDHAEKTRWPTSVAPDNGVFVTGLTIPIA